MHITICLIYVPPFFFTAMQYVAVVILSYSLLYTYLWFVVSLNKWLFEDITVFFHLHRTDK